MKKSNIIKTTTAGLAVVTMMLGAGFTMVSTANAAPATGNDIQIVAPANTPTNFNAPTINGRKFTAFQFARYTNVEVDANGVITGYDLLPAPGVTDDMVRSWIEAAITSNKDGNTVVDDNYTNVVAYENGKLKFIGDAENLTALQFVGKYMNGAGSDVYGNNNATNNQLRLFAQSAAEDLDDGPNVNAVHAVGANNTVDFAIPDTAANEGYYLITEDADSQTETTGKSETIARAMIVPTAATIDGKTYNTYKYTDDEGNEQTETLGVLKLKAEKVTVEKDVQGNDQLVTVGSTRTFEINTNVPMYEYITGSLDYTDPVFWVSDNPSDNLTPDLSSVVVKVIAPDDDPATESNWQTLTEKDYTVDDTNAGSDDTNDFRVTLTNPRQFSGHKVKVTYSSTVNALPGDNGSTENTAHVEFTNDPTSAGTANVEDIEKLIDAEVSFDKVKFDNAATQLVGAEFQVTDAEGNAVKFTKSADGLTYTVADATATNTVDTIVTGVMNGTAITPVSIRGLGADSDDAVSYHFTETKAPAGYILGENPVEFNLVVTPTFTGTDGTLSNINFMINGQNHPNFLDLTDAALIGQGGNSKDVDMTADITTVDGGTIRVENTTNISDFAKTGGEILAYAVVAAVLLVAGAGLMVVARRRNKDVA